ncbi:hypothetical protein D6825_03005 [Candidatus Woesearchaeota archaeon]|nr:MAG: hypothetical protein D6825_03005 [Candidatus Woesearchaeota archaeon]
MIRISEIPPGKGNNEKKAIVHSRLNPKNLNADNTKAYIKATQLFDDILAYFNFEEGDRIGSLVEKAEYGKLSKDLQERVDELIKDGYDGSIIGPVFPYLLLVKLKEGYYKPRRERLEGLEKKMRAKLGVKGDLIKVRSRFNKLAPENIEESLANEISRELKYNDEGPDLRDFVSPQLYAFLCRHYAR